MVNNNLNRTQLAEKFGVSKGYISQILNGDADHRISKLVEISLGIGLVPKLEFENLDEFINKDKGDNPMSDYLNEIKSIQFYSEQNQQSNTPIYISLLRSKGKTKSFRCCNSNIDKGISRYRYNECELQEFA